MAEWCFQFSFQKHPRAGGQRCPAAVFIVFPSGVQRVGAEWRIGLGSLLWGPNGGSLSEVVEHVEPCWTYLLQNTSAKHVVDRSTAARSGKESRFFWDKGGMDMDPWGLRGTNISLAQNGLSEDWNIEITFNHYYSLFMFGMFTIWGVEVVSNLTGTAGPKSIANDFNCSFFGQEFFRLQELLK